MFTFIQKIFDWLLACWRHKTIGFTKIVFCGILCSWYTFTKAQCPGGGAPTGNNLVVNGNFNAGNTGFSSGYDYTTPNTTEGQYYVGDVEQGYQWNGGIQSDGGPNGATNFMLVNGYPASGVNVWCQTIPVTPNTVYVFSLWISSLSQPYPAVLQFFFNGVPLSQEMTAPLSDYVWTQFTDTWNSGANTSVTICFIDLDTLRASNDFGIGDISLAACGCNAPVSGTIAANPDTVCQGAASVLSVNGGSGKLQWQSSVNGITFTNLPGDTIAPYTTAGLIQTTYYRVTTSNICGTDSSLPKAIYVTSLPVAGTITVQQDSVCYGNIAELSDMETSDSIRWQSSADGITFANINGATSATYNTTDLTQTTYFRVIAHNNCGADSSPVKAIYVFPQPVAGTIVVQSDSVCFGSFSELSDTGASGNIQWQSSVDGISFNDIPGATSSVYYAINLQQSTYFRVMVSEACAKDSSTVMLLSVFPVPVIGIITFNPNPVCEGQSSVLSISGVTGSMEWQVFDSSGNFTDIAGADSLVYTTPPLLQTTYYRAWVNNSVCSDTSTTFTVLVNPTPAPPVLSTNDSLLCASDSTLITTSGSYAYYLWNNGDNTPDVYANTAGGYWVTVTDANGCTAVSKHQNIRVFPVPPVSISVFGDTLTAFNAVSYQWYLNDTAIANATLPVYIATKTGDYFVQITDTNGCKTQSNYVPISVSTGILNVALGGEVEVYPNPLSVGGWQLVVDNNLLGSEAEILDDNGRLVYKAEIKNIHLEIAAPLTGGVYLLRITCGAGVVVRKLVKL